MIWCNKIWSSLFINKVPILLLFILIPCSVLYEYSSLHLLHCTWLECIKSYTKNPSYGFFTRRWFVHNQFMVLVNSLKDIMYYLLIRRMTSLGHQDGVPMLGALVCLVMHLENIKLMSKFVVALKWSYISYELGRYWCNLVAIGILNKSTMISHGISRIIKIILKGLYLLPC